MAIAICSSFLCWRIFQTFPSIFNPVLLVAWNSDYQNDWSCSIENWKRFVDLQFSGRRPVHADRGRLTADRNLTDSRCLFTVVCHSTLNVADGSMFASCQQQCPRFRHFQPHRKLLSRFLPFCILTFSHFRPPAAMYRANALSPSPLPPTHTHTPD